MHVVEGVSGLVLPLVAGTLDIITVLCLVPLLTLGLHVVVVKFATAVTAAVVVATVVVATVVVAVVVVAVVIAAQKIIKQINSILNILDFSSNGL